MTQWDWLVKPEKPYSWTFARNVVIKAILLFIGVNVVYALVQPLPWLSQVTLYGTAFPARSRLPYADNPDVAYNVSLNPIEGLFASHILSESSTDDKYQIFIVGDSSVWGWLLDDTQTFDACINGRGVVDATGKPIKAYNLGYPSTNALKDLMIISEALQYQPDLIIWLVTLESLYDVDQTTHPILQNNAEIVLSLIDDYSISLNTEDLSSSNSILDRTLWGQRRELADWLRHQLFGIPWTHTHIDHVNPRFFRPAMENLPASEQVTNRAYLTPENLKDSLAIDVIQAGVQLTHEQDVTLLIVNEPILVSSGINSDKRYNELHPRWIYDRYRGLMLTEAEGNNWRYLDLWNAVPAEAFTDFPLHYNAEWTCNIAEEFLEALIASNLIVPLE